MGREYRGSELANLDWHLSICSKSDCLVILASGISHPASGFKTAFDLDLLSRGQVMLCQRFNAHIFD